MVKKRFHDINIWEDDWFIKLSRDHKIFWMFVKDTCDHAGIWRTNISTFKKIHKSRVEIQEALKAFNEDKDRVLVLPNGRWFLINFIPFQYGRVLNLRNRVHESIVKILKDNDVKLTSIRPQIEVNDGVKDKDKDKDKESLLKLWECSFCHKSYPQAEKQKHMQSHRR